MRIKLKLKVGFVRPEGIEISDEAMAKLVADTRWRPGIALIGEHKINCTRIKTLDGYLYKINGQNVEHVDAFNPSECIPWRDGELPEEHI